MSDTKLQHQNYRTTGLRYAGFWIRLFAGFLDIIFLLPLIAIFIAILMHFTGYSLLTITHFDFGKDFYSYAATKSLNSSFSSNGISDYLTYFIAILYSVYFVSSKSQATWGKRILGIYVGNKDGSRLTPLKSTLRCLATSITVSICGLGFIIVAFTKEKTALHDLICQTRVFYGKK